MGTSGRGGGGGGGCVSGYARPGQLPRRKSEKERGRAGGQWRRYEAPLVGDGRVGQRFDRRLVHVRIVEVQFARICSILAGYRGAGGGSMKLWNHRENPYPFVPNEVLEQAESGGQACRTSIATRGSRRSSTTRSSTNTASGRCPPGSYGLGWHTAIGDAMSDEEIVTLARNWDALCLYAWRPHIYNPQLKNWLHRIQVPTLVLWAASDRIVTPDYGRA